MAEPEAEESGAGAGRKKNALLWVGLGFSSLVVLVGLANLFWPVFASEPVLPTAQDMSDMKQVNLSLMMYSSDSDGRYPPAGQWMDDIYPYSKSESILHSLAVLPASLRRAPAKTDPYGIAFRKSLAFVDSDKIALPEQIAVVFDSTDLRRNASGELNLLPDPRRHQNDRGLYNLIGFVDGHVKQVPKMDVIVR